MFAALLVNIEYKWSRDMPHFPGKVRRITLILRNTKGATAIEYGLIASLIAVAAITAMTSVGGKMKTSFNNVATNMKAS